MKKLFVLIFTASLFSCSHDEIQTYRADIWCGKYNPDLVMDLTKINF